MYLCKLRLSKQSIIDNRLGETASIAMSKYSICVACQCCVQRNDVTMLKAVCDLVKASTASDSCPAVHVVHCYCHPYSHHTTY